MPQGIFTDRDINRLNRSGMHSQSMLELLRNKLRGLPTTAEHEENINRIRAQALADQRAREIEELEKNPSLTQSQLNDLVQYPEITKFPDDLNVPPQTDYETEYQRNKRKWAGPKPSEYWKGYGIPPATYIQPPEYMQPPGGIPDTLGIEGPTGIPEATYIPDAPYMRPSQSLQAFLSHVKQESRLNELQKMLREQRIFEKKIQDMKERTSGHR